MVLFQNSEIVSDFLFKLIDPEKFVHNCNRQNIHVAETTCTPASAIFILEDPPENRLKFIGGLLIKYLLLVI